MVGFFSCFRRGSSGASNPQAFHFSPPFNDPFALPHISDRLIMPAIESNYRTKSGGNSIEGSASPKVDANDMRRIYVHDDDRVLVKIVHFGHPSSVGIEYDENGNWQFRPLWARRAGPRAWIYFNPEQVKAAIVTCGGLCPGLNDVIRQVVFTLETYGVNHILGIQYGFKGFVDKNYPPIKLSRKLVKTINMEGGSFLGVSRGCPPLKDIVDRLEEWNINMFYVIGGNGSHAGATAIYEQCEKRKMKMVVVGIPKTIDNDIEILDKTFGFDTAVEEAQRAINAAYTEVTFTMGGKHGVLEYMKQKIELNGICVVVVAEGAGQDLLEGVGGLDASGNPILGDFGKWFTGKVKEFFATQKIPIDAKYIDPTYMIRARVCNSGDHIFCSILGQNAVHGAFAGYTNITIGVVNTHYCFLPIPIVIKKPRMVDPNSVMYHRCVTSTGQPDFNAPLRVPQLATSPAGKQGSLQPHPPPSRGSIPRGRL
uniref:Phosphofructokinase domain-containing protein n=1 Tax=Physcomitrium patens TaxID=3218 RepID=A0A7I4FWF9_PHYPA